MAMTEAGRHELYEALKEAIGMDPATTLMEAIPPVGWADIATKRDLDTQLALIRADFDRLHADFDRLHADFDGIRADFDGIRAEFTGIRAEFTGLRAEFDGIHAEFTGLRAEHGGFRAEVAGGLDQLRSEIYKSQMSLQRTLLLGMLAAQTAFAAVLLAAIRTITS